MKTSAYELQHTTTADDRTSTAASRQVAAMGSPLFEFGL
jgi:hypothetical protein